MKRSLILAAVLSLTVAPLAVASPAIMKDAKAKDATKTWACTTCHSKLPGTKANLTEEGLKWVKK
jgi:hypothetical protein